MENVFYKGIAIEEILKLPYHGKYFKLYYDQSNHPKRVPTTDPDEKG